MQPLIKRLRAPLLLAGLLLFFAGGVMVDRWTLMRWHTDGWMMSEFHRYYHQAKWANIKSDTRWLGVPAMKIPFDLWVFQEVIFETRPDVLIETGTNRGGSAYYYVTLFELLGHGRVYTMDIEDMPKPTHARLNFRLGSSTAEETLKWIRGSLAPGEHVMVTLDALHDKEHVLRELDLYSPLVTVGNYLVVEDTHLNGHPVRMGSTPTPGHDGPWEAVQEWLPRHPEFVADRSREKFALTFNPGGWLKRIR